MILVDVYVPYMNTSFDFNLDDTATISSVIEEVVTIICAKEHWKASEPVDEFRFFSPSQGRVLDCSNSLKDELIQTAHKLILC